MKKIPIHKSQNKTKIFIPINKIMTNTSRLSNPIRMEPVCKLS